MTAMARVRQLLHGPERERGSASVFIVLIAFALLVAIALAVDGSRKAQAASNATAVAEEAARAGGQALRELSLATGQEADVDPQRAVAEARRYLTAAGAVGTVSVRGNRIVVEATITRETVMLRMVGIDEVSGHGEGAADLVSAG